VRQNPDPGSTPKAPARSRGLEPFLFVGQGLRFRCRVVREGTQEEKLQRKRSAEFLLLRKLNESRSKTDQKVWDMVV
jgi:hypothetical protein